MTALLGPRLRHRVSFDAPFTARDSDGNRHEAFAAVSELQGMPAEVLTGPGKETVPAAQPVSTVAARITLRYHPMIANPYGMRVRHGDAVYHIETWHFDVSGRHWVTLICSAGAKYV